jgi:hypothetical protein
MTPTPSQIRMAAINIRQLRTHGARVLDALQHVRQSQKRQSPLAAGFINTGFQTPQQAGGRHGCKAL